MLGLKGSIKEKLLSLIFLLFAVIITLYIFKSANKTRQTLKVPVINKNIEIGYKIQDSDFSLKEIGAYNIDTNIILNKSDIVTKYAVRKLYKNRFIYKDDITNEKPAVTIKEKLKYGAVAVHTDLAKCVGGIPEKGDYVSVAIIKKTKDISINEQSIIVDEPDELSAVKIIEIQNNYGTDIKNKENKTGDIVGGSIKNQPSIVVFDAQSIQRNLLLQAEYGVEIHLILLPQRLQKKLNKVIF